MQSRGACSPPHRLRAVRRLLIDNVHLHKNVNILPFIVVLSHTFKTSLYMILAGKSTIKIGTTKTEIHGWSTWGS